MNLAAILPRFSSIGFQAPQAHRPRQAAAAALPDPRTLPRRAIMALDNRPLRLHVLRGCVWITRDGCPADTVLEAGGIFEQQPGARVLVQALEDAELLVAGAVVRTQNA